MFSFAQGVGETFLTVAFDGVVGGDIGDVASGHDLGLGEGFTCGGVC